MNVAFFNIPHHNVAFSDKKGDLSIVPAERFFYSDFKKHLTFDRHIGFFHIRSTLIFPGSEQRNMKQYVETLGNMISDQVPDHPDFARFLLNSAYSWVHLSPGKRHGNSVQNAYGMLNRALAGTIVDSFRHPERSVMVNLFMPCEILHAMKLTPMFPEGISAYLACTNCQNVFAQESEAGDVPESFCSYHKTMIGLAESGVMPAPLMIANTTLACDANQLSFSRLSDSYRIPHTVIDVPYISNPESIHYVADQLRGLTARLEDLSHRKLNEEQLKEAVARSAATLSQYQKFLAVRGPAPCLPP